MIKLELPLKNNGRLTIEAERMYDLEEMVQNLKESELLGTLVVFPNERRQQASFEEQAADVSSRVQESFKKQQAFDEAVKDLSSFMAVFDERLKK
jgi:hypothetical protein